MKTIAVLNEFSIEAIRDALQKLNSFPSLYVNGLTAFQLNEIEKTDPVLFSEIREKIVDGRWYPYSGMWIESDEKISEYEFTRNILYSVRYFKDNFDKQYRVFHGGAVCCNYFAQIVYHGGFDAAVVSGNSEAYWLDSADMSRIFVCGEGRFNIADVNDLDKDSLEGEFTSFEDVVIEMLNSPLELKTVKSAEGLTKLNETEELLLNAEKISACNGENLSEDIRSCWISVFLGDEKTATKTAEDIAGARSFDSSFIALSEGVRLVCLKYAENSDDVVLRIADTDGREKTATLMCDALNAGFRFEIMPYETITFRINSEGFAEETGIDE